MDKKSKQSNPVRMIRGEYIYFTERERNDLIRAYLRERKRVESNNGYIMIFVPLSERAEEKKNLFQQTTTEKEVSSFCEDERDNKEKKKKKKWWAYECTCKTPAGVIFVADRRKCIRPTFFFIFLVRETKELWLEYIYYIYNDLCMQWNVTRMVS